jgi:hypothetical protein
MRSLLCHDRNALSRTGDGLKKAIEYFTVAIEKGVSSIERPTGVEFARGLKQITHDIFLFFPFG